MNINKTRLDKIRKKYNLSLILLHGSQVDGKIHPKSDVDIAVVKNDDNQTLKLFEFIKDMSNALKSDRIDVSDLTHGDPLFLYSVAKKSRLISGLERDYSALIKLAYFKYCDYLPFFKKEREFVIERINTYVSV